MIKVFEDFDLATVGRYQSLLEAEGIRTYLKNQYTSSVLGEIPFLEGIPQLWILEERDLAQANSLIRKLAQAGEVTGPDWACPNCQAEVDAVFDRCWNCEQARPANVQGTA
jgi:hypothetical protein